MTARKKAAPKRGRFAVEFSGAELEDVADLIENKLTTLDAIDREDDSVERRLQAVADRIKALGPLRPRMHLPGRFGRRGAGGAA